MSQHTLHTEKTGRGRRIVVFGVSVPVIPAVLTVLGAGVALAAVLLTTTIDGTAVVKTVGTSNELSVTPSAANGSALDCSDIKLSSDFTKLTFNPVLTKTVNGGNSGTTPITGGECTITLTVKNTGTNPIKVDTTQTALTAPTGWSVTKFEGNATSSIAPNASATVKATLKATEAAQNGGKFGGKLVYTDAA